VHTGTVTPFRARARRRPGLGVQTRGAEYIHEVPVTIAATPQTSPIRSALQLEPTSSAVSLESANSAWSRSRKLSIDHLEIGHRHRFRFALADLYRQLTRDGVKIHFLSRGKGCQSAPNKA
jgi:hypothetical protein